MICGIIIVQFLFISCTTQKHSAYYLAYYANKENVKTDNSISDVQENCSAYQEGVSEYDNNRFAEAILLFNKAIHIHPTFADAYQYRILAYYNLEDYKSVIKYSTEYLKQFPYYNESILTLRASAYTFTKKYSKARKDCKRILAKNADNAPVQNLYQTLLDVKVAKAMRRSAIWSIVSDGLQAAGNLIGIISGTPSTSVSTGTSNYSSNNVDKGTYKEVCSFCHGTGKNPAKERAAFYRNDGETYSYDCQYCKDRTGHYHKDCPSCFGKKYILKSK